MLRLLPFLAVLLAGAAVAVQAPTNAALARASGSVVLAALVSFGVGTAVLALVWAGLDRTPIVTLRTAPGWAWLGGLYGAGYVAALAFVAPRIGLATTVIFVIAGQLLAAIAIDRFGLLGLRQVPIGPVRLVGVALVLGGVLLVRRG